MDDKLVRLTITNIVRQYEVGPYSVDMIDELTAAMVGAIEDVAQVSYSRGHEQGLFDESIKSVM